MEIDLGSFVIRDWRRGDEESLVRHANNPKVAHHLRDRFPHPYTLDDAKAWIDHACSENPVTNFAIVVHGDAVGGIGFERQQDIAQRSLELGYWLGEAHWGRGIVTEAVRAVTRHMFANFDVCRIYSTVFEENPGSVRVLEKAGFTCEGRLRQAATKGGRTFDLLLYALVKEGTQT
jgi:RimJ/RimL family protein N-acetyltransferase